MYYDYFILFLLKLVFVISIDIVISSYCLHSSVVVTVEKIQLEVVFIHLSYILHS